MLKIRPWIASGVGFAAAILAHEPQGAHARPQYLKVFKEVYPARDDLAKCAVCHFGEKKTNRTDYGKAFEEALGAKNVKDNDAIKAALKKAEDKLPGKIP